MYAFFFYLLMLAICATTLHAQSLFGDPVETQPDATKLRPTDPKVAPAKPDDAKKIAPDPAPHKTPPRKVVNRVAATVNGRPVTSNEVTFMLLPIVAQLHAKYPRQGPEFQRQIATAKTAIINDLIDRELVLSDFESKGYKMPDMYIENEINRIIRERYNGNRDLFLKELKTAGMDFATFKENQRRQVIVQAMRASKFDQDIPPTPQEIDQEYSKSKTNYRDITKDRIKLKKILIPAFTQGLTSTTPEEQLALAEKIVKQLTTGAATFDAIAKAHSTDLHAENGGDWPEIVRGELSPEFAAIVFDSPLHTVVGPIIESTGFTIVQVQHKTLAPAPPLHIVRDQIDQQVRTKRNSERYRQWVDRLRSKALIHKYI